jgi:hypothetical protein
MLSIARGAIVKLRTLLRPPGVLTEMLATVFVVVPVAVEEMTRLALIEATVTTGAPESVMPAGRFSVASTKPVPAKVTGTVAAAEPCVGVMLVSTGVGAETVKVTAVVVPPGVVTVMLCAPRGALSAIAKGAVI